MKHLVLFISFLLLSFNGAHSIAVENGSVTKKFSPVVQVVTTYQDRSIKYCSGVLISHQPLRIMTAAHCVGSKDTKLQKLHTPSWPTKVEIQGQSFKKDFKINLHENLSNEAWYRLSNGLQTSIFDVNSDQAMIEISKNDFNKQSLFLLESLGFYSLSSINPLVNESVMMVGYGYGEVLARFSFLSKKIELTTHFLKGYGTKRAGLIRVSRFEDDLIACNATGDLPHLSFGDSGAPLLRMNKTTHTYEVIGIASYYTHSNSTNGEEWVSNFSLVK